MSALALRSLKWALKGLLAVLALGCLAGWVRVMPWVFAEDVPLGVVWPFARLVLAATLEVAVWVGAPLGCALGWRWAAERGELLALAALGVHPARWVLGQGLLLTSLAAPLLVAAVWLSGPVETAPGRALSGLVEQARAGCGEGPIARVPGAGLVHHCESGWLVGRAPGRPVWFAARSFEVSADGRRVELGEGRLMVRAGALLQVEATRVSVRGLPAPAGRERGLARALWLACAVGVGAVWLRFAAAGRAGHAVVGMAASAVLGLGLLQRLDGAAGSNLVYAALVGLALGLPLLALFVPRAAASIRRTSLSNPRRRPIAQPRSQ
ncbi:MAG: hypothetical protein KIT72_19425 [Polyangiaceae bacterium]|nr:hypothetical protein [Polyangiaceae bacterium]MCW5792592.1 hypothetical protein [Polyangiaceae bacterium]